MNYITPSVRRAMRSLVHLALLFSLLWPTVVRAEEPPLPPPPPIRDARFGAVQAYDGPEVATSAGVGWTRVLFWWHQVQPNGPDYWNPHYFPDTLLERELADGRQMIGLLQGTAPWASEDGNMNTLPQGLYLPSDDLRNLWGQYAFRMSQRYAGKIDHWVIWNEPDVWEENHPGKSWHGTLEDYVQLLKVGYQSIKAGNPNAVVHLAATTYWWDAAYGREQYFTRVLEAIRADPDAERLDGFFDVASAHIYFKPEHVYSITAYFRKELNRLRFNHKPLWINEMNSPPSEDPQHPAPGLLLPVSLEEQSCFLVQGWAMGLAAGAERIAIYKTRDEAWLPEGVEPYGFQRKDGSVRPVFWTYRMLQTYLGGYQRAQLTRSGGIRIVVVSRGELGQTTVVWNMDQRSRRVRVRAADTSALLVDPFGPVGPIKPTRGFYTLDLPPSARGFIGGTPFLIVEGAGMHIPLEVPEGLRPAPTPVSYRPDGILPY